MTNWPLLSAVGKAGVERRGTVERASGGGTAAKAEDPTQKREQLSSSKSNSTHHECQHNDGPDKQAYTRKPALVPSHQDAYAQQAYTPDTYGIDVRAAKNVGQGNIQIYRVPVAHQSTQVATETRNTPQIV